MGLMSSELPLNPVRTGTSSAHTCWFCGVRVAGCLPQVCCSDEKMLKALIMSYWVKDVVQKDKLDTARATLTESPGESLF